MPWNIASMRLFLSGDVMTGRGIDQILPTPSRPGLSEPAMRSAAQYVELAERRSGPIPRPVDFGYVWGDLDSEILYPMVRVDDTGQLLSGANKYELRFAKDQIPPAKYWRISMYDIEGFFFDNPINRYSINRYLLTRGKLHTEGGKLVIYVQSDEPAAAGQRKNWLPAPKTGAFQFAARFYGPDTSLIDGSYDMPGVVRAEGTGGRALQ